MSAQPAAIRMSMGARIFVAAATKENDYRRIHVAALLQFVNILRC